MPTLKQHSSYVEGYTDFIFGKEYRDQDNNPELDGAYYDRGFFDARNMERPKYDVHISAKE